MVAVTGWSAGVLPPPREWKFYLDLTGLDIPAEDQKALFGVDKEGWKAVIPQIEQHFAKFGAKLPAELNKQLDELKARLA